MELSGQVAFVTGAARGLGRAIARRLAADGADLMLHYNTRAHEAAQLRDELRAVGRRVELVQADFVDARAIRRMFETLDSAFPRFDIVIANASMALFKPTLMVTDDELDRMVAANVKGNFIVLKEAARRIADGGRIVHISTAGTRKPGIGQGLLSATLGAVDLFAQSLAHEVGSRDVRVNIVSPGAMNTEGFRELLASVVQSSPPGFPAFDDDAPDPRAAMSPLNRVPDAEEVADIVAMLVSTKARWLTAQNIFAAGGAV